MDLQTQEYFGWAGNAIFVSAQLFQIVHTHKIKTTRDISYGLQILFFIGDPCSPLSVRLINHYLCLLVTVLVPFFV